MDAEFGSRVIKTTSPCTEVLMFHGKQSISEPKFKLQYRSCRSINVQSHIDNDYGVITKDVVGQLQAEYDNLKLWNQLSKRRPSKLIYDDRKASCSKE